MEDRSFYVYAHYRLDTMEPFYIGKGKNGRKNILSRNSLHDNVSKKHGHAVVILYDNLTEEEAFFYEREVIEDLVFDEGYEIDCNGIELTKKYSYLTNFTFGGEGATGHNPYKNKNEEELELWKLKKSNSLKGRIVSDEQKKNQSISMTNKVPKNVKKCYCEELNLYFQSSLTAEKYCKFVLNTKINRISKCCDGKINHCGSIGRVKLHWKWIYDESNINENNYIDIIKIKQIEKENSNYKIRDFKTNGKECYCYELNMYFNSCSNADRYCRNVLKIKLTGSGKACSGKIEFSGIYNNNELHWDFIYNVNKEILENAIYIDDVYYKESLSKNVKDCK